MRAPPLRVQRYSPGELPGNAPQASVHMTPATSSTHKACSRTWSKCRKVVTNYCHASCARGANPRRHHLQTRQLAANIVTLRGSCSSSGRADASSHVLGLLVLRAW